MNICTEHKTELCYEGRDCPACELQNEIQELKERIETEENANSEMKSEIADLKAQVKELESQIA